MNQPCATTAASPSDPPASNQSPRARLLSDGTNDATAIACAARTGQNHQRRWNRAWPSALAESASVANNASALSALNPSWSMFHGSRQTATRPAIHHQKLASTLCSIASARQGADVGIPLREQALPLRRAAVLHEVIVDQLHLGEIRRAGGKRCGLVGWHLELLARIEAELLGIGCQRPIVEA